MKNTLALILEINFFIYYFMCSSILIKMSTMIGTVPSLPNQKKKINTRLLNITFIGILKINDRKIID